MEKVRAKAQAAIDQANAGYSSQRSALMSRFDGLVSYLTVQQAQQAAARQAAATAADGGGAGAVTPKTEATVAAAQAAAAASNPMHMLSHAMASQLLSLQVRAASLLTNVDAWCMHEYSHRSIPFLHSKPNSSPRFLLCSAAGHRCAGRCQACRGGQQGRHAAYCCACCACTAGTAAPLCSLHGADVGGRRAGQRECMCVWAGPASNLHEWGGGGLPQPLPSPLTRPLAPNPHPQPLTLTLHQSALAPCPPPCSWSSWSTWQRLACQLSTTT
jgi:hypothetical protein